MRAKLESIALLPHRDIQHVSMNPACDRDTKWERLNLIPTACLLAISNRILQGGQHIGEGLSVCRASLCGFGLQLRQQVYHPGLPCARVAVIIRDNLHGPVQRIADIIFFAHWFCSLVHSSSRDFCEMVLSYYKSAYRDTHNRWQ